MGAGSRRPLGLPVPVVGLEASVDVDDGRARLLELFGGRSFTVQLPCQPNAGTRRLLAFLGVEVETVADKPSKWTPETVVEAMRVWEREHGSPPSASQWALKADGRPTVDAVRKVFGSWATALVAAGFPVPGRGGSKPGRKRAAASRVASAPRASKPEPPVKAVAEGTFQAKAERIVAAARAFDEARASLAAAEAVWQAASDEWQIALREAA